MVKLGKRNKGKNKAVLDLPFPPEAAAPEPKVAHVEQVASPPALPPPPPYSYYAPIPSCALLPPCHGPRGPRHAAAASAGGRAHDDPRRGRGGHPSAGHPSSSPVRRFPPSASSTPVLATVQVCGARPQAGAPTVGLRVSDISTRPAVSSSAVSISGTGSSSSSTSSYARARKPKLRHRPWSVVSEQILHACGTGDCLDWSVSVRGGDDNDRTRVKVDEGTWRLMLNDFCHPTTGGMWRTRREALATMTRQLAGAARAPREAEQGLHKLWEFALLPRPETVVTVRVLHLLVSLLDWTSPAQAGDPAAAARVRLLAAEAALALCQPLAALRRSDPTEANGNREVGESDPRAGMRQKLVALGIVPRLVKMTRTLHSDYPSGAHFRVAIASRQVRLLRAVVVDDTTRMKIDDMSVAVLLVDHLKDHLRHHEEGGGAEGGSGSPVVGGAVQRSAERSTEGGWAGQKRGGRGGRTTTSVDSPTTLRGGLCAVAEASDGDTCKAAIARLREQIVEDAMRTLSALLGGASQSTLVALARGRVHGHAGKGGRHAGLMAVLMDALRNPERSSVYGPAVCCLARYSQLAEGPQLLVGVNHRSNQEEAGAEDDEEKDTEAEGGNSVRTSTNGSGEHGDPRGDLGAFAESGGGGSKSGGDRSGGDREGGWGETETEKEASTGHILPPSSTRAPLEETKDERCRQAIARLWTSAKSGKFAYADDLEDEDGGRDKDEEKEKDTEVRRASEHWEVHGGNAEDTTASVLMGASLCCIWALVSEGVSFQPPQTSEMAERRRSSTSLLTRGTTAVGAVGAAVVRGGGGGVEEDSQTATRTTTREGNDETKVPPAIVWSEDPLVTHLLPDLWKEIDRWRFSKSAVAGFLGAIQMIVVRAGLASRRDAQAGAPSMSPRAGLVNSHDDDRGASMRLAGPWEADYLPSSKMANFFVLATTPSSSVLASAQCRAIAACAAAYSVSACVVRGGAGGGGGRGGPKASIQSYLHYFPPELGRRLEAQLMPSLLSAAQGGGSAALWMTVLTMNIATAGAGVPLLPRSPNGGGGGGEWQRETGSVVKDRDCIRGRGSGGEVKDGDEDGDDGGDGDGEELFKNAMDLFSSRLSGSVHDNGSWGDNDDGDGEGGRTVGGVDGNGGAGQAFDVQADCFPTPLLQFLVDRLQRSGDYRERVYAIAAIWGAARFPRNRSTLGNLGVVGVLLAFIKSVALGEGDARGGNVEQRSGGFSARFAGPHATRMQWAKAALALLMQDPENSRRFIAQGGVPLFNAILQNIVLLALRAEQAAADGRVERLGAAAFGAAIDVDVEERVEEEEWWTQGKEEEEDEEEDGGEARGVLEVKEAVAAERQGNDAERRREGGRTEAEKGDEEGEEGGEGRAGHSSHRRPVLSPLKAAKKHLLRIERRLGDEIKARETLAGYGGAAVSSGDKGRIRPELDHLKHHHEDGGMHGMPGRGEGEGEGWRLLRRSKTLGAFHGDTTMQEALQYRRALTHSASAAPRSLPSAIGPSGSPRPGLRPSEPGSRQRPSPPPPPQTLSGDPPAAPATETGAEGGRIGTMVAAGSSSPRLRPIQGSPRSPSSHGAPPHSGASSRHRRRRAALVVRHAFKRDDDRAERAKVLRRKQALELMCSHEPVRASVLPLSPSFATLGLGNGRKKAKKTKKLRGPSIVSPTEGHTNEAAAQLFQPDNVRLLAKCVHIIKVRID